LNKIIVIGRGLHAGAGSCGSRHRDRHIPQLLGRDVTVSLPHHGGHDTMIGQYAQANLREPLELP